MVADAVVFYDGVGQWAHSSNNPEASADLQFLDVPHASRHRFSISALSKVTVMERIEN